MPATRILLVDDHRLFREGLAGILAAQPEFEVVGEAADGVEAVVKARRLRPDMILMDVSMPQMDGVEATRLLNAEMPQVVIVMLTVRDDDENLFAAVKSGARGYLLKTIRSRDLLAMLRAAKDGEAALAPRLAGRILSEFRRMSETGLCDEQDVVAPLTPREIEVLTLVAAGATDKEIANKLVISIHTVKSHMRNILSKLQLCHRYEAAQYARRLGIIPSST
jgi:DNA-binding NarL/FixJ family response regulator